MNIDEARRKARRFCERAVDYHVGRSASDPVALDITEGRIGKGYSSCGDLAHALLYHLGVREPWINRDEHEGWSPAVNISRLAGRTWGASGCCPVAFKPSSEDVFETGDILIVWNAENGTDAHALVVDSMTGAELNSWDYGQPGGKRRKRQLRESPHSPGHIYAGDKRIQCAIRLEGVLMLEAVTETHSEPPAHDTVQAQTFETLRRGMRGSRVARLQKMIAAVPDGAFGAMTRQGVLSTQAALGLEPTGECDQELWEALRG